MRPRSASIPIGISATVIRVGLLFAFAAARARAQTCIGDCDSDGEVTLGEVQRAFNISTETAPRESCEGFDTGADDEISRVEVKAAFVRFLRGCPDEDSKTPVRPMTAVP